MKPRPFDPLSRRERQLLDALFQWGEATVADLHERLPDFPSYNALRAALGVLVQKGLAHRERWGRQYVYRPQQERDQARNRALDHLVQTLFDGSTRSVLSTLLNLRGDRVDDAEYEELSLLLEKARKRNRRA